MKRARYRDSQGLFRFRTLSDMTLLVALWEMNDFLKAQTTLAEVFTTLFVFSNIWFSSYKLSHYIERMEARSMYLQFFFTCSIDVTLLGMGAHCRDLLSVLNIPYPSGLAISFCVNKALMFLMICHLYNVEKTALTKDRSTTTKLFLQVSLFSFVMCFIAIFVPVVSISFWVIAHWFELLFLFGGMDMDIMNRRNESAIGIVMGECVVSLASTFFQDSQRTPRSYVFYFFGFFILSIVNTLFFAPNAITFPSISPRKRRLLSMSILPAGLLTLFWIGTGLSSFLGDDITAEEEETGRAGRAVWLLCSSLSLASTLAFAIRTLNLSPMVGSQWPLVLFLLPSLVALLLPAIFLSDSPVRAVAALAGIITFHRVADYFVFRFFQPHQCHDVEPVEVVAETAADSASTTLPAEPLNQTATGASVLTPPIESQRVQFALVEPTVPILQSPSPSKNRFAIFLTLIFESNFSISDTDKETQLLEEIADAIPSSSERIQISSREESGRILHCSISPKKNSSPPIKIATAILSEVSDAGGALRTPGNLCANLHACFLGNREAPVSTERSTCDVGVETEEEELMGEEEKEEEPKKLDSHPNVGAIELALNLPETAACRSNISALVAFHTAGKETVRLCHIRKISWAVEPFVLEEEVTDKTKVEISIWEKMRYEYKKLGQTLTTLGALCDDTSEVRLTDDAGVDNGVTVRPRQFTVSSNDDPQNSSSARGAARKYLGNVQTLGLMHSNSNASYFDESVITPVSAGDLPAISAHYRLSRFDLSDSVDGGGGGSVSRDADVFSGDSPAPYENDVQADIDNCSVTLSSSAVIELNDGHSPSGFNLGAMAHMEFATPSLRLDLDNDGASQILLTLRPLSSEIDDVQSWVSVEGETRDSAREDEDDQNISSSENSKLNRDTEPDKADETGSSVDTELPTPSHAEISVTQAVTVIQDHGPAPAISITFSDSSQDSVSSSASSQLDAAPNLADADTPPSASNEDEVIIASDPLPTDSVDRADVVVEKKNEFDATSEISTFSNRTELNIEQPPTSNGPTPIPIGTVMSSDEDDDSTDDSFDQAQTSIGIALSLPETLDSTIFASEILPAANGVDSVHTRTYNNGTFPSYHQSWDGMTDSSLGSSDSSETSDESDSEASAMDDRFLQMVQESKNGYNSAPKTPPTRRIIPDVPMQMMM